MCLQSVEAVTVKPFFNLYRFFNFGRYSGWPSDHRSHQSFLPSVMFPNLGGTAHACTTSVRTNLSRVCISVPQPAAGGQTRGDGAQHKTHGGCTATNLQEGLDLAAWGGRWTRAVCEDSNFSRNLPVSPLHRFRTMVKKECVLIPNTPGPRIRMRIIPGVLPILGSTILEKTHGVVHRDLAAQALLLAMIAAPQQQPRRFDGNVHIAG